LAAQYLMPRCFCLLPRNNNNGDVNVNMCLKFSFKTVFLLFKLYFIILLYYEPKAESTHIRGTWNSGEFFQFIAKFGFQRTTNQKDSFGYIFGNITGNVNSSQIVTLAVLDRGYFLEYYGNRSVPNRKKACELMFRKIKAFDPKCNNNTNAGDFLRSVPCPKGELCTEEDDPWDVIKGHQFTYAIEDLSQPR